MKSLSNHEEQQYPESELSKKEKQMLQAHQDQAYLQRWEKVIESNDQKDQRSSILKWILALAVLATAAFFLFGENRSQTPPVIQSSELAGLVDYPFMEQQIRGDAAASQDEQLWKEAIARYKKGEYTQALDKSQSLNRPFFKGMCLLQLKRYEAAIAEFDLALQMSTHSPELNYYKGYGLMQLGRKAEAKTQLQQALASKELREAWRASARKLMAE